MTREPVVFRSTEDDHPEDRFVNTPDPDEAEFPEAEREPHASIVEERVALIERALTLLDRIGEEAADALIAGTAAVVPVEATEAMHRAWDVNVVKSARLNWPAMLAAGRLDRARDG